MDENRREWVNAGWNTSADPDGVRRHSDAATTLIAGYEIGIKSKRPGVVVRGGRGRARCAQR